MSNRAAIRNGGQLLAASPLLARLVTEPAVLAIDLGTVSGWAVGRADGVVSGWVDFKPKRTEGLERQALIFDRFAAWVADLLHEHKPNTLVLEKNPRLGHLGQAAPVLLGLRAVALVVARRHEVDIAEIPSSNRRAIDKSDESDARRILARWLAREAA